MRSKTERESGTIRGTLEELLRTATSVHAAAIKRVLKRFAYGNLTGRHYYLSLLHIHKAARIAILSYEKNHAASPMPSIETPWTTRWDKCEIKLGRKPELS